MKPSVLDMKSSESQQKVKIQSALNITSSCDSVLLPGAAEDDDASINKARVAACGLWIAAC